MWRTLGEVCSLKAGKAISAYEISPSQTSKYPIPCFGGNGLRGYVKFANQQGEKSLIGRQGALCGNVCYATGDYYATEHAVVVTDRGHFNCRFLYHVLVHKDLNQYKTAGAQPGLSVAKLETILVPVPDMSIQNRIAHVLDNFDAICSDLSIGLPAEIEARKKQYEYYRDLLLSFDCSQLVHVERERERERERENGQPARRDVIRLLQYVFGYVALPIEAVAQVKCGVRVIRSQLSDKGQYPVYQNSMTPLGYSDKKNCTVDTAFIISAGAAGEIGYSGSDFWAADDCIYFDCSEHLKSRFLYYVLQSRQACILTKVRKASVPRLSRTVIEKMIVSIPPLKEQERIISILDRFDTLCNDLTSGLPAEIEARQKQYEYYRDKLLTFKELSA